MSHNGTGLNVHEFSADLTVDRRESISDRVVLLEFKAVDGEPLPSWEPGAHIDLLLSGGLVRQYSLCGDPSSDTSWRVAVLLNEQSRGGSAYVHENLVEGATVTVRGPRNHFALVDSPRYLFIAGGIGITPILPMIAAASRAGSEFELIYLGRRHTAMPFVEELRETYGDRVTTWTSDDRGRYDLTAHLAEPLDQTLIYSCGPEGLMAALEECGLHWPSGTLHLERFAAKAAEPGSGVDAVENFQIVCQRSGVTVEVSADVSILDALEDAEIDILSSCSEGVCGTCEATVLEGVPDHRDSMLSAEERAAGNVILTCVSRSRTEKLVLDL